ncbi:hypothetical protein FE257_003872 [Aspergillus nanangensis]|uniref:DUF7707 domain-containing protein n=1 Tax=Aspergillus nanangensis TaxID=2582783 RepID=A0AAD4CB31_ASPNN|nr:hypothetical protein FE257_003872 [Aspergillus nanangensis]
MLPTLLVTSLMASVAVAEYSLPDGFNIGLVKPATKASWCVAERNSCPKICGGVANTNICDPDTLDFTCKCSNGSDANVALYASTVPFFVCQENYGQCIGQSTTQDQDEKCKEGLSQCGSLNASDASSSSSSSTSSSASLPTETSSSSSNSETSTPTTTTSNSAAATTNAAIRMAQEHATGLLATVLFVGLRLVL